MTEQELFRRIELKRQLIELTEIEIKQMEAMLKIKADTADHGKRMKSPSLPPKTM